MRKILLSRLPILLHWVKPILLAELLISFGYLFCSKFASKFCQALMCRPIGSETGGQERAFHDVLFDVFLSLSTGSGC